MALALPVLVGWPGHAFGFAPAIRSSNKSESNLGSQGDLTSTELDGETLKRTLKEALAETLREQRELFHEVFAEVLEDFALAEAIREGQQTKSASREEVFRSLRSKS